MSFHVQRSEMLHLGHCSTSYTSQEQHFYWSTHTMTRIITVAGFVALLVTATIAVGSYAIQPVNAQCSTSSTQPYGSGCVSGSGELIAL